MQAGDTQAATGLPLPVSPAGEARRLLTICNACRYCEGLCAVFPALERRSVFTAGDITQLANLCHDCRACFDACMYAPPHEFDLNLPAVLSAVRLQDYRRYVWPRRTLGLLQGWRGVALGIPAVTLLLAGIALVRTGPAGLVAAPHGAASPYLLLPYPVLLAVVLLPALFAIAVTAAAARRYWRDVSGAQSGVRARALVRAVIDSLTLRYLRGGGAGCFYQEPDDPSPSRRRLHGAVAYGFGLCFLSTCSAAVLQDLLGTPPPYPWLSVPVISGTAGGAAIVIGCSGLLWLKPGASGVTSAAGMVSKDYALLASLNVLALTGLATLFTRSTPAFGLVFLTHLVAIAFVFIVSPYGKFPHFVYRFLALLHDKLEADAAGKHSA